MVRYCSVDGCFENSNANKNRRFFRFPSDELRCKHWIKAIGRIDLEIKTINTLHTSYFVCEVHFADSDRLKRYLRGDAVPTLLLPQPEEMSGRSQYTQTDGKMLCCSCKSAEILQLNTLDVERFIECVKKYPILYDPRHEFYDDFEKKSKTWRHVGRELDEFAEVLRSKWEDLKDGYSRYKRSQVATANKQWRTWCWGDNMKFLDDYEQDNAAPGQGTANSAITCKTQPGGSAMSDTDEDFEAKLLKLDAVDHLFASYAETFRRFSLRNQCAIKIKMAKMFADTEQAEFDEPQAGGGTEGGKETVVVKLEDRTLLEIVEVPIIIKQERIDDDSVRP